MADALFDSTTLAFDVAGEPFEAKGRAVRFDGFQKVYGDAEELKADKETAGGTPSPAPEDEEQRLPTVGVGEKVAKVGHDLSEKQTKPPGRYSEGTLVKALERLGIGRPSTYATIVKTIKDREYVGITKGKIQPTRKGETVVDFLSSRYGWIVDYDFTRSLEERLDEVEEKGADWKAVVSDLKKRSETQEAAREGGEGPVEPPDNVPSGKQIHYVKALSVKYGVHLPEEFLTDKRGLSKWIKDVLNSAPMAEPATRSAAPLSVKQMAVIERNAPEDVKAKVRCGDFGAGRAFLEEFFTRAKAKGYPGKRKGPRGKGRSGGPKARQ